jgi:hypothetical protein
MNEWIETTPITGQTSQNAKLVNGSSTLYVTNVFVRSFGYEACIRGTSGFNTFARSEWSLFVEAPPAVVLPVGPGYFLDREGDLWNLGKGELTELRYAPFTRLEPVPETAKKVLDQVRKLYIPGPWVEKKLGEIAAKFGVGVDK